MRPTLVFAAAAALLTAPASAVLAQPLPAPPPPPVETAPEPATDFTPTTTAADMAALDARIESDDSALLRRFSVVLAQGAARMRAIEPALAFHGSTFLPNFYVGVPKPYPR